MKKLITLFIIAIITGNSVKAQCSCNPNNFCPFEFTYMGKTTSSRTETKFEVKCNEPVKINSCYKCDYTKEICERQLTAVLKNSGGEIITTISPFNFPFGYTFAAVGSYVLEITPICAGKACATTSIYFNVLCATTTPPQNPCDVAGYSNHKFKSIALNTRNGGVWLIDEKDSLTGGHFNYSQLIFNGAVQYNSTVENLTSFFGLAIMHSKNGLGMMSGGHPSPFHVRKILEGIPGFPMPTTTYVYGDPESYPGSADQLWYLNEKGYIKSATSTTLASNIPPEKFAKMFTVYNRRFFMIDENNQLWIWKSTLSQGTNYGPNWVQFGNIKAVHLTTDQGLGTPLWYIGTDNMVYALYNDDPATPSPISMNAKAKSIAVFGSQLYYIGLDGYFYLRVSNRDIRVAL